MTAGIGEGWGIRKVSVPRVRTIKWKRNNRHLKDTCRKAFCAKRLRHLGADWTVAMRSLRNGHESETVWHIIWPETERAL